MRFTQCLNLMWSRFGRGLHKRDSEVQPRRGGGADGGLRMGPSPSELAFSVLVRIPLFCIFVTVGALGGAACLSLSLFVSLCVSLCLDLARSSLFFMLFFFISALSL